MAASSSDERLYPFVDACVRDFGVHIHLHQRSELVPTHDTAIVRRSNGHGSMCGCKGRRARFGDRELLLKGLLRRRRLRAEVEGGG